MAFVTDENRRGDNGKYLTRALFWEWYDDKYPPIFTLGERETHGCRSMYQEYMLHSSEYDAAIALLGSWPHWCELKSCDWFKPYLAAWEHERETRDKAIAKRQLEEAAREGNVTAQKLLFSGVEPPPKKQTKKQVKDEQDATHLSKVLDEAYKASPLGKH